MKYKRERRSKPKSKSSKLDRRKLKKFLKQRGISSLEAMVLLDSSLKSRVNGRKHRDSRRSDSAKHFLNSSGTSKSHDRQSNGRKHTKNRIEKKRQKKSSGKTRETSSHNAHTSKMYNGHRKHSSQSSSSSPSPSKKTPADGKRETEASKLIRKMLENMDSDSHPNASSKTGRSKEAKRQSTSMEHDTTRDRYAESSSSNTPDDKRISSKMFKKYSDSFAQYLLENMSSNSLDSSSDSDTPSTDGNNSNNSESSIERPVGHESPTTVIILDSDEEAAEANPNPDAPVPTNETPPRTAPIRTTPTRTTPTRTTPTRTPSPTLIDNDHHIRVRNIKKEKKTGPSKVYRKNHRTITQHHIQPNERLNSQSSADEEDPESSAESDNSSESPQNLISYNSYAYVTKSKRRKKLRPPKLMRKISQRSIPSTERMKTKQTAFEFDVTEEEPHPNHEKVPTPEKRKSPVNLSPKQKENPHRLALVTYNPRYVRHDENWEDEEWSNLSEEDDFSDYHNEEANDAEYHDDEEANDSLDEDFVAEDDDEYVRNGVARANFADYGGVRIDFGDRPQIIEINMPVPNNDDPHQLVVESEETIEYAEAQSENANIYANNYDDIEDVQDSDADAHPPSDDKFPLKIVESTPDATHRLSISDIILRMSVQDVDTSVELSKEIVDAESIDVVATTTKGIEQDGSMIVDEVLSEPSSISMDDENVGSPNGFNQNDTHPFTTTSQFLNASNSKQVLVLLKTKIYFHGALTIRLIAGSATIFGYELIQNETVFAYSPRSDNFLFLSPSDPDHHRMENNVEVNLHGLPDVFVSSELERIVSDFDSTTDAIVLLESDSNNKSIYMIENYMKETIFSNLEIFDDRLHPFQLSESILRCRFLTHTDTGIRINPQWQDVVMTVNSRQMIIGGKGVGKSTFLRYLINKNLQEFEKILLIDLDICLPEMFVPQTVSATIITEPILGPGYIRNASPYKSYLFGDVNVLVSPIKYLKCVLKLLKHCSCRDELRSMPWVINTMGYSHGFGLELIAAILRALNPTDLIQIQSSKLANNVGTILNAEVVNSFCFNIFKNEVQCMQNECTYLTYVCNTMCSERQQDDWDKSQKDLGYAMILSKLGSVLQGNVNWITDVRPLWAYLNQMKVLVLSDDCDNVHSQSSVLNGNLVYLCQSSGHVADEDIVECYGIGIVRSVETANDKIYLLPAITKMELCHVNVIAICNIPLPPALLLNQSSRIGGRIPYVYSSDNFVGSKKNVPNSCRPEKRMSNNHIKLV